VKDKKVILIFVLTFLLILSAAGLIYYVKLTQKNLVSKKEEIKILVAKKDIKKYQKITKNDLSYQVMQKRYVPFKVLLPAEVVGKLSLVPIFKDEPIRVEKLTDKVETKKEDITVVKALEHDLYNINFRYFTNPNYTLKKDDVIDIIGVWTDASSELKVKTIVKSAKVAGFLSAGNFQPRAKMSKKIKNKDGKNILSTISADELLLDIESKKIKHLIEIYNRGKQLWMVLANKNSKNVDMQKINRLSKSDKKTSSKAFAKDKVYKSEKKQKVISATISYAEDKKVYSYSKTVNIKPNILCKKTLIVTSKDGANVRFKEMIETKRAGVAFFGEKLKYKTLNGEWYELCSGMFMHKSVAKAIY